MIKYTSIIQIETSLNEMKSIFTREELEYIEYRRHNASHIFQNKYEKQLKKNGDILTERKGISIDKINDDFQQLLRKHGSDRGFDKYMLNKLFPLISELNDKIQEIQSNRQ